MLFIDYIITDAQLLTESGDVHIDSTDNGMSDHFLELGRISRKQSVQLDSNVLISLVMMLLEKSTVKHYRQRLRPFQRELVKGGIRGDELVEGVLKEWESIVNRVARDTVGEKVIVCGGMTRSMQR